MLLVPHLKPWNADELLAACERKTKAEIEQLLAERFPRADVPARVQALAASPAPVQVAPGPPEMVGSGESQLAPGPVGSVSNAEPGSDAMTTDVMKAGESQVGPGAVETPQVRVPTLPVGPSDVAEPRARVAALAPQRFAVQFTFGQAGHDKLRHAQALLGHQLPTGDLAALFELALDVLVQRLEKRKFAAAEQPRAGGPHRGPRASSNPRYVPAGVKRAAWKRDGGQCTFVSETGRHCEERHALEFDHVKPVARGGRAKVADIRLRCRAHNQYAAECVFGAGFMHEKRNAAQRARSERCSSGRAHSSRDACRAMLLALPAPHP